MNSILLHLDGGSRASAVIDVGVELARRRASRVRGITMLDTRRIESLTANCETAAHAVREQGRLQRAERVQYAARTRLSQACLDQGLNFDVRNLTGDPLRLLEHEAQFHDLIVMSHPIHSAAPRDKGTQQLLGDDLLELLFRGVQPLLVLRERRHPIQRVLMIHDGSLVTGRSIRSFLEQDLFPQADHRLLTVGTSEPHARLLAREMAEYCVRRRADLETGCTTGPVRRVLVPYAEKWQADLIVLGVNRTTTVVDRLLGVAALKVLRKTPFCLYACS